MKSIIFKNSVWFLGVQTLTKIIAFLYTVFVAKSLGVSDFGLYVTALAYFSIMSSIADFGFNRFLIREIAVDKSKASTLLWSILMFRLTLTTVLFAIFSVILYIQDSDKTRVSLILLATLAILPQSIAFTLDAIFVAWQKLKVSAISLFLSSLSIVLLGLFLVLNGFGVYGALIALVIGQAVYVLVLILFLHKYQGLVLSKVNLSIIKKALIGSLPYGLLGILGLLYFKIDTVLLSYLKGNFEAGIYGAAYKFLEAIIFIPSAISLVLFPVLARIHDNAPKELGKIYFKSFKVMLMLGLVVFLGYISILPLVIKNLLPNYLSSIEAIRILSLSIPFMFIQVPAVTALLSTEKYLKTVIILSILTLSFNLIANIIFIPTFGFIAASWVTVASEVLSFIVFFLLIKIKFLNKSNI